MEKLKSAWQWLREWSWALLLGVLGLAGVGWAIRQKHMQLGEVRDALAVARAQGKIAELKGRRDQLLTEVSADHALVRSIDEELIENKRKILREHGAPALASDEEIIDAFRKLGY